MNGKVIIVGATGYTGSALARSYSRDNVECHLIARNEDELNKLSEETGQKYSICSDVTNSQSVEESLKEIENEFLRDILTDFDENNNWILPWQK